MMASTSTASPFSGNGPQLSKKVLKRLAKQAKLASRELHPAITPHPPPATWADVPEGQYATVNNAPLHYLRWNPNQAPTTSTPPPTVPPTVVVLVHGIGDYSSCWSFLGPYLAGKGYTVIAPDLPGHGRSPLPAGGVAAGATKFSAEARTTQLDLLLHAVGVGSTPCAMIGHSMGGALVTAFAAAYPGRVKQLGLLAPAGLASFKAVTVLQGCCGCCWRMRLPLACLRSLAQGGQEDVYKSDFFDHAQSELYPWRAANVRLAKAVNPHVKDSFIGTVMEFPLQGLEETVATVAAQLQQAAAAAGKSPALIMWGKQDTVVPPTSLPKWVAALAPAVPLVTKMIDGAGHAFFLERMEETHSTIAEWLGGQLLPDADVKSQPMPRKSKPASAPTGGAASVAPL